MEYGIVNDRHITVFPSVRQSGYAFLPVVGWDNRIGFDKKCRAG